MRVLCAVKSEEQICITFTLLLLLLLLLLNVVQESVLKDVNQKEFHVQEIVMKKLKK